MQKSDSTDTETFELSASDEITGPEQQPAEPQSTPVIAHSRCKQILEVEAWLSTAWKTTVSLIEKKRRTSKQFLVHSVRSVANVIMIHVLE